MINKEYAIHCSLGMVREVVGWVRRTREVGTNM